MACHGGRPVAAGFYIPKSVSSNASNITEMLLAIDIYHPLMADGARSVSIQTI